MEIRDAAIRQKSQFVVVTGTHEPGTAYMFQSAFPNARQTWAVAAEGFEDRQARTFTPLGDDDDIAANELRAHIEEEFKSLTNDGDLLAREFSKYIRIRQANVKLDKDPILTSNQQAIENYLRRKIYPLLALSFHDIPGELSFLRRVESALSRS